MYIAYTLYCIGEEHVSFFPIVSVRQLGHKKTEKEKKMRQPFAALPSYINIYICVCVQLYIYPSLFSFFSLVSLHGRLFFFAMLLD